MLISLKDNDYQGTPWSDASKPVKYEGKVKETLLKFDGVSLKELADKKFDSRNFLVFPFNAAKKDLEDKDYIYSLKDKSGDTPAFCTGNVMCFLGLGNGVQMHITSRFDDCDRNYFLHYMLQKVCNVAFTPNTDSNEEQFYDFLYYLFPSYLNEALKQGIYRAYETREYNDANVRGPIDINRHIRYNIPFNGKVAYHTREYTTDNNVTQLVRHTIEHIRSLHSAKSVLGGGMASDTRDNVRAIELATESYNKNARAQVISKNLRRISHPYYSAYEPLRKICLAILLHKKLSYGNNANDPISGILFDGASLWEEYLATVFEEWNLDFVHSNNRLRQNGINLFEKGGIYFPDFYRRGKDLKKNIVLDAKYKKLANISGGDESDSFDGECNFKANIGRGDLFQMLAYMHCIPASRAILLFPIENFNNQYNTVLQSKPKTACGQGGTVKAIGIPIPQGKKIFADFRNEMRKSEESLIEKLKETLK